LTTDYKALQREHDPSDVYGLVVALPAQIGHAREIANSFVDGVSASGFARVGVCGMGGSAIGGDLARAFLGERLSAPIISVRGYQPPAYLRDDSLVVLSSYSGNTGETLASYDALKGGTSVVVAITGGGELAQRCDADGVPVCRIPGGMPPRTAVGYSLVPLLMILRVAGLASFADWEIAEAEKVTRDVCAKNSIETSGGRAGDLAGSLVGTIPFVYAAAGLLEGVARRWSCQFEENAKTLSHYGLYTELNHNEIVGWQNPADCLAGTSVISLCDTDDHPLAARQREIGLEIVAPLTAGVHRVDSPAGGRLARMIGALVFGDLVSVYLALRLGVNPAPVEKIDFLKSQLNQGDVDA